MKKHLTSLKYSFPICLFFVFTVVLYGPLSLYLPNAEEFWFTLRDVLHSVIPFSLIVLLIMLLFFLIIPLSAGSFFRKLLFGVSLGLYIQGNYININYGNGVLDGTAIRWEDYRGYGIVNTIIWVVCITLPFVIGVLLKKKKLTVEKIIVIASLFLTVIQVPALVIQAASFQPNENTDVNILADGEFSLSENENVIVFILDTMDEAFYTEFLESHPDYQDNLEGFVHYGNTLASGARTPVAVPSMFTGIPFKRMESYSQYKKNVWSGENALSVMNDAGYDVRFYSEAVLFSSECAQFLSNFDDGGTPIGSQWVFLKKLYKLDLYKFVPHFLKKYVWIETAEFDEAIDASEHEAFVMNDMAFLESFRQNGFSVNKDQKKAVRIYHLKGAHNPYRMGENGEKSADATLQTQVTGVLYGVLDMIDDLKEQGVYDQSTIIITADHGDVNKAEQPILLLKQADSTGPCKESNAPVSLFDLPIFLANIAGEELDNQIYGTDLLAIQEDETRERHFFQHAGSSNDTAINEYMTTGKAGDHDALQLVQTYEGEKIEAELYEPGTMLSFGVEASGNQYVIDGFAQNTGMRTALRGPHSVMEIPFAEIPNTDNLLVSISFNRPSNDTHEYDLVISANGEQVFHERATKELDAENLNFTVPTSLFDSSKTLTLEFAFPELSEDEMEKEVSKRTNTIRFISMVIDAEKS